MSKRLTTDDFITKSKEIHGDKYDYSNVDYINARTNVKIICKLHGVFNQSPDNHLHGKGCCICGLKKQVNDRTLSVKEFIDRANKVHNYKYNYSSVDYHNNRKNVSIICKIHGVFNQFPDNHLKGNGCPVCHHRISKSENDFLDFVGINNKENRQKYISPYKIDGYDPSSNTIYEFLGDYYHGNLELFDAEDYNYTCHKTYGVLYYLTFKKFNLLKRKGYNIKYIWESDWKKFKAGFDKIPNIKEYGIN